MEENMIQLKVKSLGGEEIEFTIMKNSLCLALHQLVANQMNIPFEMLKLIWQGKSLLTFENMYKPLACMGLSDGDTIHSVLRLGGPQPEERAVFQFIASNNPQFTLERLQTLFQNNDVPIECPICMNYAINRITSCYHWMCKSCFNICHQTCPFCRATPMTLL